MNKVISCSLIALAIGSMVGIVSPAHAFYETTDRTESVAIPSSSTAFMIGNFGDTASGQTQTEDTAFFEAHKVPGKVALIPHSKLSGTGGKAWYSGADYYVSTSHVTLVDRQAISRKWTGDTATGTSAHDESFHCQTTEGLNVRAEVSVIAHITPEQAANYLYHFGTEPQEGDLNTPAAVFQSVYRARSLANIMDGLGHGLVGQAVCNAIGVRPMKKANEDYIAMLTEIQKMAKTYFADQGITIDSLGWAGTFTFDDDVQKAINNAYVAQTIQPYLQTLKDAAVISAIQGWDHKLPQTLVLGSGGNTDAISAVIAGLKGTADQKTLPAH